MKQPVRLTADTNAKPTTLGQAQPVRLTQEVPTALQNPQIHLGTIPVLKVNLHKRGTEQSGHRKLILPPTTQVPERAGLNVSTIISGTDLHV